MLATNKDKLPNKISVITWLDITSEATWVGSISEIKKEYKPMKCVSVGWIIHNTKKFITIADSFSHDYTFGSITTIPTGVIINIIDLDSKSPLKYINKQD